MTEVRPDFTTEQNWRAYSDEEHAIWRLLFERQQRLLVGRACREYLEGLGGLGVAADGIPDFRRLSDILDRATGWQIVAVPSLVPDDVFFAHLARRRFPSTCFIRRRDQLDYLREPDVFHDVCGHVPLLMSPVFADYLGLWRRRVESARARPSTAPGPALLVHRRVRADRDGRRPAHLRVRHPVFGRRINLLSRRPPTPPAPVRSAADHANPLPYRRLPAALFRHRRFSGIIRRDSSRFCADLSRNRHSARSRAHRPSQSGSRVRCLVRKKNWATHQRGPSLGRKRLEDVRQDHNR